MIRIIFVGLQCAVLLIPLACSRKANIAPPPPPPVAPRVEVREVTRYREVTREVESTCEGERWVEGEIPADVVDRIAVYPLEIRDANPKLARYWTQVIEDWLLQSERFSVTSTTELRTLLGSRVATRSRPDPEMLAALRRGQNIQAVLCGTVDGARGGPKWALEVRDSESGEILWSRRGSGDLAADLPEILAPAFGYRETYSYTCSKTVTEKVPYVVREKIRVAEDSP